MIFSRHNMSLGLLMLLGLCFSADSTELGARLEILPSAFLPGVTTSVQLTCFPPLPPVRLAQVVSLELFKQHAHQLAADPVASYVTTHAPVLEVMGRKLGASVSGSYNSSNPEAAMLVVTLPQPQDAAAGGYSCVTHGLDSSGLLHDFHTQSALVSLAKNQSVPDFYHELLRELRSDLDTLTSDLSTVQRSQAASNATDKDIQTKLSAVTNEQNKITGVVNDVNAHFNVITQANASLHAQLDNLRALTPAPVNFYAVMTTNPLTVSTGRPIVFNYLLQSTDHAYSTSTGCFTSPTNGTYYFRVSLMSETNQHLFASVQVNGQTMSSLHAYDDFSLSQASASLVVGLKSGDAVCVVKKGGNRIYRSFDHSDYLTSFLGLLLW